MQELRRTTRQLSVHYLDVYVLPAAGGVTPGTIITCRSQQPCKDFLPSRLLRQGPGRARGRETCQMRPDQSPTGDWHRAP